MTFSYSERTASDESVMDRFAYSIMSRIHKLEPAKVISFDTEKQTIKAQPLIKNKRVDAKGKVSYQQKPVLVDVPVCFPQYGNFVMTMPPKEGDEVIIGYGDGNIDNWWYQGNIQNAADRRKHDMSDGIALVGINSRPNIIKNISSDACEIRTKNGAVIIQIKDEEVTLLRKDPQSGLQYGKITLDQNRLDLEHIVQIRIATPTLVLAVPEVITENDADISIAAHAFDIQTTADTTLTTGGNTNLNNAQLNINNHNYLSHRHTGVDTGSGTSGAVTP